MNQTFTIKYNLDNKYVTKTAVESSNQVGIVACIVFRTRRVDLEEGYFITRDQTKFVS